MEIHDHAANGDIDSLRKDLAGRVSLDLRDENGHTPLMVAVVSPRANAGVIRFLISSGAEVNAAVSEEHDKSAAPVLSLAVKETTLDKIIPLVEAGANVGHIDQSGYSILLDAMHRSIRESPAANLALLTFLIDSGAPLDTESKYEESALSVAARRGDFDQLKLFLDRGADPVRLAWSPLFYAVAFESLDTVRKLVDEGASLTEVDDWERTPLLVSVCAGRVDIAEYLLACGSDQTAKGRCGNTALMYAIQRDDVAMLKWLIAQGWDVEEQDEFGGFPLIEAVQANSVACVNVLLKANARADRCDQHGNCMMRGASSREMVEVLYQAGGSLSDVEPVTRRVLLGHTFDGTNELSEDEFQTFQNRRFGKRNPERMNNRFWEIMVRSRESAYTGASKFVDSGCQRSPVWCFNRFGQSLTRLPDGRHVEIGGEHEDFYDPDFCIYNDVVVHHGDGTFDIYGYPDELFPPMDFHSATYVASYIYIIGCLGYPEHRQPGTTPIFRLHCESWKIERVSATGLNPGWIHRHKATLIGNNQIRIRGGKVLEDEQVDLRDNIRSYVLDLAELRWRVEE